MIFSHGGELFTTCDVCGSKFVHKKVKLIKAGHLHVCNDPKCIVEAMHCTWVPRIDIDDDTIIDTIAQVCNVPRVTVAFHCSIAKTVYKVMVNPNLISYEETFLIEAIVHNEFSIYEHTNIIEYAKTIDVLLKPEWLPYWRRNIDTNYPFATLVACSAKGQVIPWLLNDLRNKVGFGGNPYGEQDMYDSHYPNIDLLSSIRVPGCDELPISKGTIVLWQLYMHAEHNISMFSDFGTFTKCLETWSYPAIYSTADRKKFLNKIAKIANSNKNFDDKVTAIIQFFNDAVQH